MRVISFNANGIRAASRRGFFDWLPEQGADVVAIQELKAQQHQLEDDAVFWPDGFHCFYAEATRRKGYSGVGLYTRREPNNIVRGMGVEEFDTEGRYLEAQFDGFAVATLYAPSGSSGEHRQDSKERWLAFFPGFLAERRKVNGELLVCGDWNIAHTEKDLKNWRSNRKNSGFLPHERAWLDQLFGEHGFVDAFRVVDDRDERYTWWSNRGQAWENNVGWRIDYHVATTDLAARTQNAEIYQAERLSDHAPLTLDYDWPL